MTETNPHQPPASEGKEKAATAGRKQQLAEALRANLRRRKQPEQA